MKSLEDKGQKSSDDYIKLKAELDNLLNKFKDLE